MLTNTAHDERRQFKAEHENKCRIQAELSDYELSNPERRANRVKEEAQDAPNRTTEKRVRSVSVERDAVKQETVQYLRQDYTVEDDKMICQICRSVLPFKLADNLYYFEAVEFLKDLKKRHYQNYLALCPNHAAMFKHANESRDDLKEKLLNVDGNEVKIKLAGEIRTIYFTKKHLIDLRAIIEADSGEQEGSA